MDRSCGYNLFLLLAGVVVGVAAGPDVLGRLVPKVYQKVFDRYPHEAQDQLDRFEAQVQTQHQRLAQTGATQAALEEFDRRHRHQRRALELEVQLERHQQRARLWGTAASWVLALVMVMAVEAWVSPPIRHRLATARYAVAAVWVAMVLANGQLHQTPIVLTCLLAAVALMAGAVPTKPNPQRTRA